MILVKEKKNINKGFTLIELIIGALITIFITGTLVYVFGEANFFFKRESYRENVNNYADFVMNDIFSNTINANFVNIRPNEIVCGYKTDANLDSIRTYRFSMNKGVTANKESLFPSLFHSRDRNRNYYMQVTEFGAEYTLQAQQIDADVRDAVIDVFLGIQLHYKKGNRVITEEFPYKRTIFTRYATVYNNSKENND